MVIRKYILSQIKSNLQWYVDELVNFKMQIEKYPAFQQTPAFQAVYDVFHEFAVGIFNELMTDENLNVQSRIINSDKKRLGGTEKIRITIAGEIDKKTGEYKTNKQPTKAWLTLLAELKSLYNFEGYNDVYNIFLNSQQLEKFPPEERAKILGFFQNPNIWDPLLKDIQNIKYEDVYLCLANFYMNLIKELDIKEKYLLGDEKSIGFNTVYYKLLANMTEPFKQLKEGLLKELPAFIAFEKNRIEERLKMLALEGQILNDEASQSWPRYTPNHDRSQVIEQEEAKMSALVENNEDPNKLMVTPR